MFLKNCYDMGSGTSKTLDEETFTDYEHTGSG